MEELPNEGKCGWRSLNRAEPPPEEQPGPNSKSKDIIGKSGNQGGGGGTTIPTSYIGSSDPTNETELKVEGVKGKALIDSGVQISAISKSMAQI